MGARGMLWRALELMFTYPRVLIPWLPLFLGVWLLGGYPTLFGPGKAGGPKWLAFQLLDLFLGAWAAATTLLLVRSIERQNPMPLSGAARTAFDHLLPLLGLGLVSFLVSDLPFLLFGLVAQRPTAGTIVLGLLLLLWLLFWEARFFFCAPAIVYNETYLGEALRISWRHTHKMFLSILSFFFLVGILTIFFELLARIPGARAFFDAISVTIGEYLFTVGAGVAYFKMPGQATPLDSSTAPRPE